MELNNNQAVTLLLTTPIGITDKSIKPLSLGRWNTLVKKIIASDIKEPGNLLNREALDIKNRLSLDDLELTQITSLLKNGTNLAIALEDLNRRGIYFLCRSDNNYPRLLKTKLKEQAPPVLFYSGNLSLLDDVGIGMVGSRNIDSDILDNTKFISEKAVYEKYSIISGGAKGVDSASETAAFNSGGTYISFICDSLTTRIKKKDIRDRIASGKVLYITMDSPNYPFTAARAMTRNKFIYSLSEGTFILNSDYNTGGTWAGAIENIKKSLSYMFVINNNSKGNRSLIEQGSIPVELDVKFSVKMLCEKAKLQSDSIDKKEEVVQTSLFSD